MTPEAISKIEVLIEEAVHANHPELNKKAIGDGNRWEQKNIVRERKNLAGAIKGRRETRDNLRKAGQDSKAISFKNPTRADNDARSKSQTGNRFSSAESSKESRDHRKRYDNYDATQNKIQSKPRFVKSAKS